MTTLLVLLPALISIVLMIVKIKCKNMGKTVKIISGVTFIILTLIYYAVIANHFDLPVWASTINAVIFTVFIMNWFNKK